MTTILYPRRYAVFDTETTGLDVMRDEIVELAVKVVEPDGIVTTKSWLLRGDRPSCPEALAAHKIDEAYRKEHGIRAEEAFLDFVDMVGTRPLIGHNAARFDCPLLTSHMTRLGLPPITQWERKFTCIIDTAAMFKARELKMARRWYESSKEYYERVLDTVAPGVKFNLIHASKSLGIDTSDVEVHRAYGDVELADRIYKAMTYA